jgi:hypothetical protein
MTISALESYLNLLLARARYGRKLNALAHCVHGDMEMINAIESDQSIPPATRKRLIRERDAEIGAALRLAAKQGKARPAKQGEPSTVVDVVSKRWPRQRHQENVFNSYRAVLRRKGRPPTFREWVEQDLIERPPNFSRLVEDDPSERKKQINAHKRKRDHDLRDMKVRFKLPITNL